MKIRSLALALALGCALTGIAEAKKKPVYAKAGKVQKAGKARKATVGKYKPSKRKVSKAKVAKRNVKPRKHAG